MVNVIKSRGNVFADIGLPDAETHLLKAELVRRIGLLIQAAKLTPVEAAACMAMAQADVPKMSKGQFRAIPLDKLLRCLVALGQDVTIGIQAPKRGLQPSISVAEQTKR